jgi:hypothetical protein
MLAGQCTLDKHGFAVDAGNPAAIVRKIDDVRLLNRTRV